ncbi:DUF4153 domain-containing protein [Saccharibacillus kuerlensis]|uniref:DUF4173 domain-containing protein n=1 Tax=Saccharibacillus kuerlensis TaxID=459527 RepID=A0ABQ2KV07_9BACL|nr:DUF4173 domain-containing protein [Saccharibacillus kuerlensis]GGN94187.1 hypothetical protein GCM10010969_08700 [Saccharibacillus kuerlensis]
MNELLMEKKTKPLLPILAALALGGLHQLLFFGVMPGVSVPMFLLLFYAYFWTFGREAARSADRPGILLFAAVLSLSLTYALFDNPVFFTLNLFALPILIAWHLTYMLGDRRRSWYEPALITDAFGHVLKQTTLHIPDAFAVWRRSAIAQEGEKEEQGKTAFKQVLYGLLLAVPVLAVVLFLLFSADGVLRTIAGEIPNLFDKLTIGNGMWRVLWALVSGLFFFAYLAGFRFPRRQPPIQGPQMAEWEWEPAKLGALVILTLLIVLNLVYVLFVGFQFSYLFGAWQGVLPESASYAEYARSGFGELIGVTFINFAMLLIGLYATSRGKGIIRRMLDGLLYLLVFCSVAMLGSAFSRLLLYEEIYGYTRLRFLVHAFMIFLFLLLILFALCVRFRSLPLGRWMVVLGLCAYLALNYACMDRVIARLNLERHEKNEVSADLDYLLNLSSDAVPVLVEYGQYGDGELNRLLKEKARLEIGETLTWQSWNLSDRHARDLLKNLMN